VVEERVEVVEDVALGATPEERPPGEAGLLVPLEHLGGDLVDPGAVVGGPALARGGDATGAADRLGDEPLEDLVHERPQLERADLCDLLGIVPLAHVQHVRQEVAERAGRPGLEPARRDGLASGRRATAAPVPPGCRPTR
jgi:hypothetical protein